ncbi:xanthine phosphoribosyltransferase [Intestinibaculum porci]|uniref:xanthine phosphoribosyltransferase n=1 Tax=Intestinibaculum porci TaxID=2487118 RepID=UPI00240A522E|nr:xanthine phosphoribosyltransferase [Intestinibaculum porci]MDD6350296.1 xanthine phosphoribosyltransferase [Intestinibaculum porci]MDD6423505.1 xanthine phosphoribosyltransferase [Intestinibaculum porci]
MKVLKERILRDGRVIMPDILKVDSFLNHQIDVALFDEIGKEFARRFQKEHINKILTIESSGIALAVMTARYFHDCPVVFVKKANSKIMDPHAYKAKVHSFTKNNDYTAQCAKAYLGPEDHILIIDDFLANGAAVGGMLEICKQAQAHVEGVGIVIEKGFQEGHDKIVSQGIHLESLAIIDHFENGQVVFK